MVKPEDQKTCESEKYRTTEASDYREVPYNNTYIAATPQWSPDISTAIWTKTKPSRATAGATVKGPTKRNNNPALPVRPSAT